MPRTSPGRSCQRPYDTRRGSIRHIAHVENQPLAPMYLISGARAGAGSMRSADVKYLLMIDLNPT